MTNPTNLQTVSDTGRAVDVDSTEVATYALDMNRRERRRPTIHEPIFVKLFDLAAPITQHYSGDLGHDVLWLARQPVGTSMVWAPRKNGTHIMNVQRSTIPDAMKFVQMVDTTFADRPAHWYLITITAKRGGDYFADGTVIELTPDNLWHQLDQLLPRK